MRAKGQDRILVNTKRVTCASEEYLASEAKRRETFMKDLRASLQRAKERKLLLEDARTERVTALVYRQKTEAERAALHEAKKQAGRQVLVMLVHALSGARVQALAQSLDYRRRLRNAAVRIQQSVRMWGAARHLQDCLAAKARIVRFFRTVVTFRRKRKEYWYAQAMLQFLVDNRMNFGQIMRDFRYRVIKCQRFARMFLACTQARVVALARVWTQQERRLAAKARSLKLQLLEKQSRRLRQEAESMRNSPRGAEYAAAKYLRQIEIPESLRACMLDPNSLASSESVASAPGTGAGTGVGAGTSVNDGALRFPVGLGLRSGREASSARVQAQYRKQVSQSSNYILDVFLNEEFQARLEQEKKRPLRLRPVPRRERYEILRDVISRARAAHQARMVKLQRERKVLETQKVKVDVSEAKKLLSEQSEVMNVTRALFSDLGRQPVLLLFSRLQEREIFRLVQSAQTRLAETRSMQQLIAQLRYE
ncbi:Hypothetical Protein FCC1311_042602 [Hondaea fermentalgiana]|uniref:Uncharacterized protein n=1 Tax=Hondaea fermentalgiana TaxID=2315210 RepID=A0A2R5GAJ4_9STRA|nr:Hypothetical Protein FCC1311_042602 [Hondaea fermentalgiana]|eukprot:GBG28037.1 Hypothetical Protein FCC1311_042602 [Hondaea fermentalgiana]